MPQVVDSVFVGSHEAADAGKALAEGTHDDVHLILIAVVLAVFMFFWFRRYIVYTEDGLRVQVPYLAETMTD